MCLMVFFPDSSRVSPFSIKCACVVALVLLTVTYVRSQDLEDPQSQLYAQLTRGYRAIAENPAEAIVIFEDIVGRHSTNVTARRQLGALYVGAGRNREALEQFRAADLLIPSDTTKLQIAYLLTSLSRHEEAISAFKELEESSAREIRERSSTAAAVLGWTIRNNANPWWGRIGADPYYDSRFNNTVFRFWLLAGAYLTESRTLSAYGIGLFTRDTRSSGGAIPVIYSDSYSLVGGGLRFRPFAGWTVDLQGGLAIDLIDRPKEPIAQGDLRALAGYGWGSYPEPDSPERLHLRVRPFIEATAMGGYYSRYKDVLGFGHAKTGVRLVEWWRAYAEVYLRADAVADTRREYYNNVLEGSVGLCIVPDFGWGLHILAEYHRGLYWDTTLPTVPYDRWYSSGRLVIVIDQPIVF